MEMVIHLTMKIRNVNLFYFLFKFKKLKKLLLIIRMDPLFYFFHIFQHVLNLLKNWGDWAYLRTVLLNTHWKNLLIKKK